MDRHYMASEAAASRGVVQGLLDKLHGWTLGVPTEICSYTLTPLSIPLEDGINISGELLLPLNQKPFGTVFIPSPYPIEGSFTTPRLLASRGYQVLSTSCRGAFRSSGKFEPFQNEAKDGKALVEWMKRQEWYTGSFGTIGGSYLGYNQWALLTDPPEDLTAAIIMTGLHDIGDFAWGTGALHSHVIAWADVVSRLGSSGLIGMIWHLRSLSKTLQQVVDSVPLLDSVEVYFKGQMPAFLRGVLTHPDVKDGYYAPMYHGSAVEKADIPILLTTGWDDAILGNVMWQYKRLSQRGVNVALTVGPYTHLGCQARNTLPESIKWLDEHLAHRSFSARPSPVRVFVTGLKEWRNLQTWPPSSTPLELYLNPGQQLTRTLPSPDTVPSSFEFDPAHPTPSAGVPLVFDNGPGRSEGDTTLASRSDVLRFDTAPLQSDVEVCGVPVIHLQHTTSHPDADLWVIVSEVNVKGDFSRTISEKYIRLPRERSDEPTILELTDCAHRFRKGTKIRLLIAGGCHPRCIRNLGTGEDPVRGSRMQVVQHTVRHEQQAVSKLVLPTTEI